MNETEARAILGISEESGTKFAPQKTIASALQHQFRRGWITGLEMAIGEIRMAESLEDAVSRIAMHLRGALPGEKP